MEDGQGAREGYSNDIFKQVKGWTKHDKYELLQALKIHGTQDIEAIQEMLPAKPTKEIVDMINYHKLKALQHLHDKKSDTKLSKKISKVPLTIWAKLLTDTYNYSELQTETATAVRIIADCENFHPAGSNDIDMRSVYHAIADAMEGKSLPDDPAVKAILHKCLLDTACTSKTFIESDALRNIAKTINLSEKVGKKFVRPTENYYLLALRHLSAQKSYNPLSIDEEYLKPSVFSSDTV